MKKSLLCSSVALACAVGLSACGGNDSGQLEIGMALSGVTKTGLTISNKGATPVPVPASTSFVFPDRVPYDSEYDIVVVSRPDNTDSCTVANGKGNTGSLPPNNISISCVIKTYTLGGTVTGLTGGDLTINNGIQRVVIPKNATTFSMNTPTTEFPRIGQIPEGSPYGLTILQQPATGFCTIANPNGIMPAASVNNISISCAP